MFWSRLCKSNWNCAWNLAFPVFISPIVGIYVKIFLWIGIFQRATQRTRILLTDNIQSGSNCGVNYTKSFAYMNKMPRGYVTHDSKKIALGPPLVLYYRPSLQSYSLASVLLQKRLPRRGLPNPGAFPADSSSRGSQFCSSTSYSAHYIGRSECPGSRGCTSCGFSSSSSSSSASCNRSRREQRSWQQFGLKWTRRGQYPG